MIHIEKFIPNEEENIVVGCSAGPDSMALLHYLIHNTKNKIICCHINHNVRKESKEEEKYLKNYCQKQNIPFEVYKIEKYGENNFENEARIKRYNFYEQTLKKYNSHYLFLAHHGDDLIETIIMKINRGSNLEGYAGIKEISIESSKDQEGWSIKLSTEENTDIREEIFYKMAENHYPILEMQSKKVSLEEIFLELTEDGINKKVSAEPEIKIAEEAEKIIEDQKQEGEKDNDSSL